MPAVSIVMPSFNSSNFIAEAIESVIAQSFPDWELIVVDDASKDGTAELVKERYGHESRVSVHELKVNQGAAVARNTAIEAARGRFVAFLDSDDLWAPNKLAVQIPLLASSDACLAFSRYELLAGGLGARSRTASVPERLVYKDLLRSQPVGCLTAVYDTEKTGKVYMPDIRMRQDWGLWLRLLRAGGWGLGIQQSLATLRLHNGSLSSNKLRATYFNYKLLREEGQLSPFAAAWGVGSHACEALFRRVGRNETC